MLHFVCPFFSSDELSLYESARLGSMGTGIQKFHRQLERKSCPPPVFSDSGFFNGSYYSSSASSSAGSYLSLYSSPSDLSSHLHVHERRAASPPEVLLAISDKSLEIVYHLQQCSFILPVRTAIMPPPSVTGEVFCFPRR